MSNTIWVSPNGATPSPVTGNCTQADNASVIRHIKNTPIDHPDGSVTEEKLADCAVTTTKIKNGAVTEDKLSDYSITSKKLESHSVTGEKIATGAVGTTKIAYNAVTEDKIADSAVGTEKIANGSVTKDKLADKSVTKDKLADFVFTKDNLADASVSSSKITSGAIVSDKIATGAVTEDKIADNSITQDKIADEAVTSYKLAPGSIWGDRLADDSITEDKIATNAITTRHIADASITVCELAMDSVSEDQLCDGVVTKEKLSPEFADTLVTKNDGVIYMDEDVVNRGHVFLSENVYLPTTYVANNPKFIPDTTANTPVHIKTIYASVNNVTEPYIDIFTSGKTIFGYTDFCDKITELFDDCIITDDDITFTPDDSGILLESAFNTSTSYSIELFAGVGYDLPDTGISVVMKNGTEKKLTFTDYVCVFNASNISHIKTYSTDVPVKLDYNMSAVYVAPVTGNDTPDTYRECHRINLIDEEGNILRPLRALSQISSDSIIYDGADYVIKRVVSEDGILLANPTYTKLAKSTCNAIKSLTITDRNGLYLYTPSKMVKSIAFSVYHSLSDKLKKLESAITP